MDHGHPKGIWHLPIRSATTINIIGNPFMNMTHRLFLKSSLFPPRVWGTVPSPLPILPARSAASTSADAGDLLLRNDVNSTGITTLTMNNPMKYNILSWAMLDVLQNQLDDIGSDSSIRVVILGANGKAFCSGHDLKEIHFHQTIEETTELFTKCSRLMMSLHKLPQPVIAKVHGVATAAGCQLVASCDLAIASTDARFGVSGINVGLFCSTPAVALSRSIQPKHALHMLLTGDLISSDTALSYGLLNAVVPPHMLDAETTKLAEKISSKSSFGIQLGKEFFYEQLMNDNLEDAYEFATERISCNLQHSDARKGIDDFVNKTK